MKSIYNCCLTIIVMIVISSCDGGKAEFSQLMLVNNSNHEILVKGYLRKNETFLIALPSLSSSWTSENRKKDLGNRSFSVLGILNCDSAVIFYDNVKWNRDEEFHYSRREIIIIDDYNDIIKYTFTNEDYKNAEDCDGNCE